MKRPIRRARWNAELDLRSLKETLQMDVLRCKTPALVRKELWTHILAYNLIRTIMVQAASQQGIEPRTISFKGTVQTLVNHIPEERRAEIAVTLKQLLEQRLSASGIPDGDSLPSDRPKT